MKLKSIQYSQHNGEPGKWQLEGCTLNDINLDNRLTVEFIKEQLEYDLSVINAEQTFFHPASKVSQIMKLVGLKYDKHLSEIERITSHITFDDISDFFDRDAPLKIRFF
jgi:hypothetical protein